MAKTIVQHDTDPGIAIILKTDDEGRTYGACTECGHGIGSDYSFEDAQQEAEIHIDQHEGSI